MLPMLEARITADPSGAVAGLKQMEQSVEALEVATREYQTRLGKLSTAVSTGITTQKQASVAVKEIEANFKRASTAAAQYSGATVAFTKATKAAGVASSGAAMHTANLAAQFNDIGVMLAAGQSPLMLAVQQGTQINQVFAQMGGKQQALRGLAAAFTSMINPMSLATLGIIAGGAALVQWAVSAASAGGEADALSEKLEGVRETAARLNEELRSMRMGVSADELVLMDAIAAARERVLAAEQSLANARGIAQKGARANLATAQEELATLERELATLREMQTAKALLANTANEFANAERLAAEYAEAIRAAVGATTLSNLAADAGTLADRLGAAAANAWDMVSALAQQAQAKETVEGLQRGFDMQSYAVGQQAMRDGLNNPNYLPKPKTGGARRSGGGGGGGGSAAVNPLIAELEAVQTALATQSELYKETYLEQQETLKEALEQRLITQEEYQELSKRSAEEYAEAMKGINTGYHGDALEQMETFMGDMSRAFSTGSDEMLRVAKIAGAAEAVINAWRGYSQAIADPTLPTLGKIAAAAQLLTAGLGAASAIRGVSTSGGGSGGKGGASNAQQALPTQTVAINLQGDTFSRASVEGLLEQIQGQLDRGGRLVFE